MLRDIEKKTLNLREGDWSYIESIASPQGIATSQVVRKLVSDFVDRLRAAEKKPDVDVETSL